MKAALVFAALFTTALSSPAQQQQAENAGKMEYFLVEKSPGVFEIEDLVNAEIEARASATDLTYYFYSRSNPTSPVVLTNNNISPLRTSSFNANKDTLFIIHGWSNNYLSDVNRYIRSAALEAVDINIFVVDWGPIADKNYLTAQRSVNDVGTFTGAFIHSLVGNYGLRLARVVLAGHSLGAHISGNAGAFLNGQVGRIVGLDPAGPLFEVGNINNRLDPTDARYVEVIHTNGGLLGFLSSIGHSDYHPNGGEYQPGCGIDITGSCAHSRAYIYYAESLSNGLFTSNQCSSYSYYSLGLCRLNPSALMGRYTLDISGVGDYYLSTNSQSPYARG